MILSGTFISKNFYEVLSIPKYRQGLKHHLNLKYQSIYNLEY